MRRSVAIRAVVIVGIEMATRDRASFDAWWPQHLAEVLDLVDRLYLRIDNATYDQVMPVLWQVLKSQHVPLGKVIPERQHTEHGRWQEDAERQTMLDWAIGQDADWAVCFDADEVIEPGGGRALRQLLEAPAMETERLLRLTLTYSSHHRPGFVLPAGDVQPFRAFRIDDYARTFRYRSDEDGLHCGSVPHPLNGAVRLPELLVVHYHATSCAEYMQERAFYDNTGEVARHGGIDWLYRCDRFGDERLAVPLGQLLAGAETRLGRIAAGEGLTR